MNEKQDTTLLSGEEKDGWTRIKFRRYLAGCEPDYDITITVGTLTLREKSELTPGGNKIIVFLTLLVISYHDIDGISLTKTFVTFSD